MIGNIKYKKIKLNPPYALVAEDSKYEFFSKYSKPDKHTHKETATGLIIPKSATETTLEDNAYNIARKVNEDMSMGELVLIRYGAETPTGQDGLYVIRDTDIVCEIEL